MEELTTLGNLVATPFSLLMHLSSARADDKSTGLSEIRSMMQAMGSTLFQRDPVTRIAGPSCSAADPHH